MLNQEQVPPPRAKTLHRRKGWIASTVRAFLHNEAYVGRWTYKRKQWQKIPGTNVRRPKLREEADVIRSEHPERRIIDDATWAAVDARLRRVSMFYTGGRTSEKRGGTPGRATTHVLSGLLHCGACGAPMAISGGSCVRYYRCSDFKKRGTCTNGLSLREDLARSRILGALRERLHSPTAIAYLRKRISEALGELSRSAQGEIAERRGRLARTEARIHGLIQFIADGDHSDYVRSTLKDLEAQAKHEKQAIAAIEARAVDPIRLPRPDDILERALNLEQIIASDPTQAREQLRRLFENGRITVKPQAAGFYIAESRLFPLAILSDRPTAEMQKARPFGGADPRAPAISCAGRI